MGKNGEGDEDCVSHLIGEETPREGPPLGETLLARYLVSCEGK